ncbi:hypothetical protein SSX86_007438 [Deinandra increscens subsp. villosa]|uniref:PGG domain-containing protein n=1 Tax=Deinandra increscens subsp. villosa TaxID=3103831 RepID=A0AAP0DHC9_9ASTR
MMSNQSFDGSGNADVGDSGNNPDSVPLVILSETKKKDYRLLYRAALGGHWELAENYIFPQNPEAYNAPITGDSKTVLHIAVGTGTTDGNHFVSELLKKMTKDAIVLGDHKGETALLIAAAIGNLKAAVMMINRNPKLPFICGEDGYFPIHRAAQYVQKKMVEYLLDHSSFDDIVGGLNPYEGESGFLLLKLVISAGFYDIALKLVGRCGDLLSLKYLNLEDSPLALIAGKPEAFLSGITFNFWQSWVYYSFGTKIADPAQEQYDTRGTEMHEIMGLRDNFEETTILMQAEHQNYAVGDRDLEDDTRGAMRNIRNTKSNHGHLLLLIEKFCNIINALDHNEVEKAITKPFFLATKLGIHELVETIVMELPTAIWLTDEEKRNALQVAILNRHEKVFSLIYHLSHYRQLVTKHKDVDNNNILHLAGKLAPVDRLNLFPGPALQMQRELQWFKAVEMCVEPSYKYMKNNSGKTPLSVFAEEHKQLMKDGEKWMKETAQSCTFVASFIATVVFAAGITVPGGTNDTGLPIFTNQKSFTIFIIATAISLFSSISSVLVFLSILTTRYTIDNFLYTLPNKLIVGLFTLFLSVTAMLIAFSAALYLVVSANKFITLVPLYVLAGLTVMLFVFSQCPLLWRMLKSTYYNCYILSKKKVVKLSDIHG